MEFRSILIGGIIPAIMIGLTTVFMKLSVRGGMSLPTFILIVGCAVAAFGAAMSIFSNDPKNLNFSSTFFALATGISWATAILCITYGLSTLALPVSVVSSLTNSNAPVPIILGAILFAELKSLDIPRLTIGTLLIIGGAIVVSLSVKPPP